MKTKATASKAGKSIKAQLQGVIAGSGKVAETFKVDVKHAKALVHKVIDQMRHAHEGVRLAILAWKGERPETLEAMKDAIKAECKAWLKDEGRQINPQSVWNYQSDLVACCNGYIAYAGMTDAKRKAFDKAEKERTGYHALVKFLRDTKRGRRNKPDAGNAQVERIKSGWKNHKKEMLKKAKDLIRYSDTDSLLALIDFANALVSARKKGNVEKLQARKAA